MRKSKITAAIISKNEEKLIAGCLDSLKGWADEIILVDGFSEDKTVEIARSYGAKVIQHRFEGDFSEERNIGIDNAAGDWVIHLDADDRVTPRFKDLFDSMIDSDDSVDVYKFKRKNFFLGHFMEHGGWYHYIPNITRRAAVRFGGRLHERPVYKGKLGIIEADVEHYPFDNIAQFVERHNRYSSIDAERKFSENSSLDLKEIKRNMIGKTFKTFWKMYIKKRGHREGMYGLIFAVLFAFTNFLTWVKYWEMVEKSRGSAKKG